MGVIHVPGPAPACRRSDVAFCCAFLLTSLLCLLLQGFGAESTEYARGLEGINCPEPPPLIPLVIPCHYDCITNHAAYFGTCMNDGTYNCICDSSAKNTTNVHCTYSHPFIQAPFICQCASKAFDELDPTWPTPTVHNYATTCDADCRCDHGALHGTCDYENHQCICSSPEGFKWSPKWWHFPHSIVYNVTQTILNFLNAYCEHNPDPALPICVIT